MFNLKISFVLYLNLFMCIIEIDARVFNGDRNRHDENGIPLESIYYDPKSRSPYRMTSIRNNLSSSMDSDQYLTKAASKYRIFGYRANGCSCQELVCSCCAGFNIPQFNFNQEGCLLLSYEPYDFGIRLQMMFNNNTIFSQLFSAKNPPPLCVPMPYIPGVDFCVKLFDIYTPGQNLHMCLDFETRVQSTTVFVLHFDCIRMGVDGVSVGKPGEDPKPPSAGTDTIAVGPDIYDPVTDNKHRTVPSKKHKHV